VKAAWLVPVLLAVACGKDVQNPGGSASKGGSAGASVGGSSGKGGSSNGGAPDDDAGTGNGSGASGGSSGKGGSNGKGGSTSKGGSSGSSGSSTEPSTPYGTFPKADVVIGQKDFVSNAKPSKLGASVTDYTPGSAAFDGKRLFVTDSYDARVLGFSSVPTSNGASAKVILGQDSASASGSGTALDRLYEPQSVHTDGTTLAVADAGNHRVLLMPTSAASGAAASVILGWPDADTPRHGCSAVLLRSPASAFIAKGKLFVADRANNRVLVWNKVPKTEGVPADRVLGQTTFTSCVANDASHTGVIGLRSSETLNGPTDVWSDGTRVLVADHDNNRVLGWSELPEDNGAAADLVIGQTSFTAARNQATASILLRPSAIAYDGELFVVADSGHNRVLGWKGIPKENGSEADWVLGQKDFTHTAANDDAQKGKAGSAPTARTLSMPTGVAFTNDALVVSDTMNRRVLVFRRQ
jgi:hypothetical protein